MVYNINGWVLPEGYRELELNEIVQRGDIYFYGKIKQYDDFCHSTLGQRYNIEDGLLIGAVRIRRAIILTTRPPLTPSKPLTPEEQIEFEIKKREMKIRIIKDKSKKFVSRNVPNPSKEDYERFEKSHLKSAGLS